MFWLIVFSPGIAYLMLGALEGLGLLQLGLGVHYVTAALQALFIVAGVVYEAIFGRKTRRRTPR
jgi:hypothetical protein